MADKKTLKKVHSTPGVYFSEQELTYASKSLGVTRLGVAGETQKGPAFQPIAISDWAQFQTYFGGTNTEKFSGSQYPKYELPYIAKEYLSQSQNLQVCRVLGLSGVNAGPAWCITAYNNEANTKDSMAYSKEKPVIIAVLRSRGTHKKAAFKQAANPNEGICEDEYEYDGLEYYAQKVQIRPSDSLDYIDKCKEGFSIAAGELTMTANNYGTFTLEVETNTLDGNGDNVWTHYAVSLNPGDKNYIINVLGQDPEKGDSEIYVEELYDIALEQLILSGEINTLAEIEGNTKDGYTATDLISYPNIKIIPNHKAVDAILTMDDSMLTRKYVGKRFLFTDESVNSSDPSQKLKVHISDDNGVFSKDSTDGIIGHIYTVVSFTDTNGTRSYFYGEYQKKIEKLSSTHTIDEDWVFSDVVEVKEDGLYYVNRSVGGTDKVTPITLDLNNYKEQYRYASTPWIVSEMKGSANDVELTKLFRFHTISDGNTANTEVKVSIENIDPEAGTFDVLIRDYNDTDAAITTLEKYKGCNLIPGSENYIAYKIGSTDENYETKSKYVTVEVNETDKTKISVPAGFMGYPIRNFEGYAITGTIDENGAFEEQQVNVHKPYLKYNTNVDEDIRITKQYFGLSDLVGIDSDVFKYKGVEAYNGLPTSLTPCFHLDSRIFGGIPDEDGYVEIDLADNTKAKQRVSVDGINGYQWSTVGAENTVDLYGIQPRFGEEDVMVNTIYEDKRYRKFTLCFYGGWDGWDYYRTSRSNTDEYSYRKYRGNINTTSGEGANFSVISDAEAYGLEKGTKAITSDYYAYLSAIRMFSNPKTIEINHLATPGIDYVNNSSLVGEVIDMVEEERGDSVYVVTTPDKPFGASDSVLEMYTPSDAVDNLEDTDIDSNYVCSSYPWNKYFDSSNSQYIYLPPTKDMVRNFAYTDNVKFPWYAAVGWNRGTVNAISPKKSLKLSEQDELYDGRLNFTNTFAQDGLRLWGDKNFQVHESPMNRISHRRALNRIKTLLSKACIGLVFDPNDTTMAKTLKSAIDPVLKNVKDNKGLVDYKIQIDDSQESRDRLELNAQVYLKLMPNLEYINITLSVLPSGMQISEV
jgi:hypothetical protein